MNRAKKRPAVKSDRRNHTASLRARRASHGLSVLEDIGAILSSSHDLQESLEAIVRVVAERMSTEVCSLYLYDPRARDLTLCATEGLFRASIGKVRMGLDEGLTGLVLERLEPVMVVDALAHPRYKYFPETGEERYHSFLGVPVVERKKALGVLVVQTLRRRRFGGDELRLLKAIAAQVASIIVQLRLSESLQSKEKERSEYQQRMADAIRRLHAYEQRQDTAEAPPAEERPRASRLGGVPAAPGFGIGSAHVLRPLVSFDQLGELRCEDPAAEWRRFQEAQRQALDEIEATKARMTDRMPEVDASLFETHRMMLEDKSFLDRIHAFVEDGFAAETALQFTVDEYVGAFARMTDRYLRERSTDVRDIGHRLLRNLLGVEDAERELPESGILVAEELTLSDLAALAPERLRGIVLATGGATSHATILAKSFEIPTVVGVDSLLESVREDDRLIVDGNSGVVYVRPSKDVLAEYERLDREYRAFNRELEALHDVPALTRDGRRVTLDANIGLMSDLVFARRHGAEGVGLYRTEFPFLTYRDFPDEEEQVALYRKVIDALGEQHVTVRTLDLGADKYPAYLRHPKEENPFLGWRSIRISLEQRDLFKVQLRAILRASAHGRVRLLLPMISSVEEVWRAKELLDEVRRELRQSSIRFDEEMAVGIMIEVPSAMLQTEELAREVDFLSLGTNDLIQYLLAVDRNNRKVASLYEPLHPAVLRAIAITARAAHRVGKPLSVCGEMAADPVCALVLIGLGIDQLSMGSFFIPSIKRLIRSVDYATAREMAGKVLEMSSAQEIKGYLFGMMKKLGVIELMEIYR
ncbi:MAG: phosphoenolpyruvate--protein phosphotransferase [Deltaproteobacteria bacterium]|nr:phosphoenolpyruvate--protein phosphotransferase [Deltaproteobacteria bacterium]